jgi:hypothetical protein
MFTSSTNIHDNVHFVTSTVKATQGIIDSIERDVSDIRASVKNREQQRTDQAQLVVLMQAQNRALEVLILTCLVE